MNWFKFLFYISLTCIVFIIFNSYFSRETSLFSFALSFILIHCLEIFLFSPLKFINEITQERIDFNLKILGVKDNNYKNIFKLKLYAIKIIFIFLLIFSFVPQYDFFVDNLKKIFLSPKAFISVEKIAYNEKNSSKIFEINSNPQQINIDNSSLIKISLINTKKQNPWKLILKDDLNNKKEYTMPFESSLNFTGKNLNELFISKNISLFLINDKKKFYANIKIDNVPLPSVLLKQEQVKFKINQDFTNKLAFSVKTTSQLPLTQISLIIRTKSGFIYEQTLADFINNYEKEFNLDYTEVVTTEIPFKEQDTLYIKAIARTPFFEQYGESKELQFKVQNSSFFKKEIIKNIEEALKELKKIKNFNQNEKYIVQEFLFNASQAASAMKPNSFIARKIDEINLNLEKTVKKGDKFYNLTQEKMDSLLEALVKSIKKDQAQDLLVRLDNLKKQFSQNNRDDKYFNELFLESRELENITSNVSKDMESSFKSLEQFLNKEERAQFTNFLSKDVTKKKLEETSHHLKEKNKPFAEITVSAAYESARKNLASALYILEYAYQRKVEKAKKNLTSANEKLENSKYDLQKLSVLDYLNQAENFLFDTPEINKEFNEELVLAKRNTHEGIKQANGNGFKKRLIPIQDAQENIERALLALDNQENTDKEMSREQDMKNHRSYMDTLTAQGTLDQSWRKKILDDIIRLKKEGNTKNSSLIDYLESRLR